MGRRRRHIISNACYDICFRAKSTLPLAAYRVIKLVIASSVARAQRDDKVILCHDIWEGSHAHLMAVSKDPQQLINFNCEVQKKITDVLKRLLGLDYCEIWEGQAHVAHIADAAKARDRIAYLYANPAQDNLVDNINKFPGYSSWKGFQSSCDTLEACSEEKVPWIRLPSIPVLSSPQLSRQQDTNLVNLLRKSNKSILSLKRYPNAWMKCFDIEENDVAEQNQAILDEIQERERAAAELREQENKSVMGVAKLLSQPILKPHTPKKRARKIFVLSSIRELRIRLIKEFKEFCNECRYCYQCWLKGDFSVTWPPGAFRPPLPPGACRI